MWAQRLHPSWRVWSAEIRWSVDMYVGTDILEELAACMFRVVHVAILGGSNLPQNVVTFHHWSVWSQRTGIFISTAVRTSNLKLVEVFYGFVE
jgi:hypothetical protein